MKKMNNLSNNWQNTQNRLLERKIFSADQYINCMAFINCITNIIKNHIKQCSEFVRRHLLWWRSFILHRQFNPYWILHSFNAAERCLLSSSHSPVIAGSFSNAKYLDRNCIPCFTNFKTLLNKFAVNITKAVFWSFVLAASSIW
jgi:hypothetical protein